MWPLKRLALMALSLLSFGVLSSAAHASALSKSSALAKASPITMSCPGGGDYEPEPEAGS